MSDFCVDKMNADDRQALAKKLIEQLKGLGYTVATAESCTGGLLASAFVDLSGASAVFINGEVTYSNETKTKVLGVSEETLNTKGAVSEETAYQMAQGVRRIMGTDVGLSTTGVAGPDGGTKEKPVGLVYIGISVKDRAVVKRLMLKGDRTQIRQQTVMCVLKALEEQLADM